MANAVSRSETGEEGCKWRFSREGLKNQGICCQFWESVVGDWEERIGGSRQQILLYVKHIRADLSPHLTGADRDSLHVKVTDITQWTGGADDRPEGPGRWIEGQSQLTTTKATCAHHV
jgi:hypothetical protein